MNSDFPRILTLLRKERGISQKQMLRYVLLKNETKPSEREFDIMRPASQKQGHANRRKDSSSALHKKGAG